jgi:PHD/YefM family antitoxin component YafN of YafNO toxin-antitoxin module
MKPVQITASRFSKAPFSVFGQVDRGRRVQITRYGKPAAYVISPEDYHRLERMDDEEELQAAWEQLRPFYGEQGTCATVGSYVDREPRNCEEHDWWSNVRITLHDLLNPPKPAPVPVCEPGQILAPAPATTCDE